MQGRGGDDFFASAACRVRAARANICALSARPRDFVLAVKDLSLCWLHPLHGLLVNSAAQWPKLVAGGDRRTAITDVDPDMNGTSAHRG